MEGLEAFTKKDIRTCSRIIRHLAESGHSIEELLSFADTLRVVQGGIVRKRGKRTPAEKLRRKRELAEAKFGRIEPRP